jgi:hypothetical protein
MLIYVTLMAVYFGIARPLGYEFPLGLAVICWIFWRIYRSIATMQETGNRNSYIPKLPLDNSTDATYPEP